MSDRLVTIASFSYSPDPVTEAELARIKLEVEGIPCFIEGRNFGGVDWFAANAFPVVKLQVRESDAQKAAEILNRLSSPDDVLPDEESDDITCPRCRSKDIEYQKFSKGWFYLFILLFKFPLPYPTDSYRCKTCCHSWKEYK